MAAASSDSDKDAHEDEHPGHGAPDSALWRRVLAATAHARDRGALAPITTVCHLVEQGGIGFAVRLAEGLERKLVTTEVRRQHHIDPFLPYEEDLFVDMLSPTHVCLLNKFNVLDHHLLVVTRDYEDQDEPLTLADFEALWACMVEVDGLGFYNGGRLAGASQRHKHLQVVRLPLSPERELPVEALIAGDRIALPLRHSFARLPAICPASELHARYQSMLREAACETGPYNLLVARGWMLLVPRSRATFEGIPVNSLAFAGALFVRDEEELRAVEHAGPMAVLRGVAFPKEPS